MPATDHELMHQCRSDAPQAFDELVRRWRQPLARILSRLSSHPHLDDLCQEVFIKVYLARHRYRPMGEFSTWLYRIALNVARDFHRRERRWFRLSAESVDERHSPAADVEAARLEQQRSVQRAVKRLPDKLREAVVLKHFGELTFAEVAEILAIPLSTAKSRVEAGLLELRSQLKTSGELQAEKHDDVQHNSAPAD